MRTITNRTMMCLGVLLLAWTSRSLGATLSYNVSLDTTALVGHPAAPFSLNFQLNDGEGIGDGNNTVSLSGFAFGVGGGAAGAPTLTNGASGSLGAGISLTDSAFFNAFTQGFIPGSQLSFLLQFTTNVDGGGTPDEFSFVILDSSGFEIPTLHFANALIVIDIDSDAPNVQTFGTDATATPFGGGGPIGMGPAQVTSAVPEPGSAILLFGGLAGLWVLRRWHAVG